MNDEFLLRVADLAKTFRFQSNGTEESACVLNNISFELGKGEAIGLIGRNGSGKSTLLKILAGFIKPTSGEVLINGKINSLIEVGGNFIPDLSGRENIVNLLKFHQTPTKELDDIVQSIHDFSELGRYFDQPIKNYSSGMFVRASVSAGFHIDADIFLIDEILMAGDASFKEKVALQFRKLRNEGAGVILASHSPDEIIENCSECFWLEEGKIKERKSSAEVLRDYYLMYAEKYANKRQQVLKIVTTQNAPQVNTLDVDQSELQNELVKFLKFNLVPRVAEITYESGFDVVLSVDKLTDQYALHPVLKIYNMFMKPIVGIPSMNDPDMFDTLNRSKHKTGILNLLCSIPPNILSPGIFYMDFMLVKDPEANMVLVQEAFKLPFKISFEIQKAEETDFGSSSLELFVKPKAKWLKL